MCVCFMFDSSHPNLCCKQKRRCGLFDWLYQKFHWMHQSNGKCTLQASHRASISCQPPTIRKNVGLTFPSVGSSLQDLPVMVTKKIRREDASFRKEKGKATRYMAVCLKTPDGCNLKHWLLMIHPNHYKVTLIRLSVSCKNIQQLSKRFPPPSLLINYTYYIYLMNVLHFSYKYSEA